MYPNSQQASTDCSSACIQSIPDTHKFQGGVGTSFSVARRLPTSLRFFTCPSDGITKHANKNAPPNKKVRKGILIMLSLKQGFTKRVHQSFQSFQLNSRTRNLQVLLEPVMMPIFLRQVSWSLSSWSQARRTPSISHCSPPSRQTTSVRTARTTRLSAASACRSRHQAMRTQVS